LKPEPQEPGQSGQIDLRSELERVQSRGATHRRKTGCGQGIDNVVRGDAKVGRELRGRARAGYLDYN